MRSAGAVGRDEGQTFPLYIGLIGILLFAAFAFFVVGFAGAARSEGQGAADSAALGAAREVRDELFTGLLLASLKPDDWRDIMDGDRFVTGAACGKASSFAAHNEATVTGCEVALPRFTVSVQTDDAVGDSVVQGTETQRAVGRATAVIEPRCSLVSVPTPTPPPTPTPTPNPTTPPGSNSINFLCVGGKDFKLDPSNPGNLVNLARALFEVRLES
ncbi:pilus assembly protein TadG-related protein [Streptomyces sp. NPDC012888]|uniref:pilus assembly protein TadG-related protein n=1 Tax=Streptomyces sp. NPDC012888 TaxID=3364855 RepID=UPI0036953721